MRSLLAVAFLTVLFLKPPNTCAQNAGADSVPVVPPHTLPTNAEADPIFDVDTLKTWKQCREYLPRKKSAKCRVDFDMTQTKDIRIPPQTHKDITVHLSPGSRSVVVLWRSSPFAACSLTTTPGPLARDLSPNVSAAFTSIGTGGAMPVAPLAISSLNTVAISRPPSAELTAEEQSAIQLQYDNKYQQLVQSLQSKNLSPNELARRETQAESDKEKSIRQQEDKLREEKQKNINAKQPQIEEDEQAINDLIKQFQDAASLYRAFLPENDPKDYNEIRTNYLYSYSDNIEASESLCRIKQAAVAFLSRPLPDSKTVPGMQETVDKLQPKVAKLRTTYGSVVDDFVNQATTQIHNSLLVIQTVKGPDTIEALSYFTDATVKVQKILDFIKDFQTLPVRWTDYSVQILPLAVYPESKVAVTVKCADAVNPTPLFDNIQFNAYFQSPPQFDISAGALISTLHGRQATTQTPYGNPATTSCPATATTTANCPVVAINVTRPQFVPGVFVDWHPVNFKLPGVRDPARKPSHPPESINTWMSEKAPRHPFGYVASLGLAAGFLVNPNNGTVQAEFFQGISFGIQRFAFLVGNHTGRSQNLTGGYYVGQQVAPGTTPTTVRNWSNALAFGITYRIPLR
jgi:hypothetical protein